MPQCQIFTNDEIASFRHGGKILRACLDHVTPQVVPGITTKELDVIAEEFILSHDGAKPAFKGYHGFPGTLCTSVNEECVHGIPGDRVLEEGDIIAVDCGVLYDELYTDACVTVPVGAISDDAQRLLDVTQEALAEIVAMLKGGVQVGDISSTVQQYVEARDFAAVRSLTGHGLGRTLHGYPDSPNVGEAGTGAVIPAGTVIAVEPIVSAGADSVQSAGDDWTLSIRDGGLSAHFEHTVLVTEGGCDIIA